MATELSERAVEAAKSYLERIGWQIGTVVTDPVVLADPYILGVEDDITGVMVFVRFLPNEPTEGNVPFRWEPDPAVIVDNVQALLEAGALERYPDRVDYITLKQITGDQALLRHNKEILAIGEREV